MRTARGWLAVLLLLPLVGCRAEADPRDAYPALPERSAVKGSDESLRADALALVDARERAVVSGDREAFLATVDPDDVAFTATQERWFDNVEQLPVDFTMQLRGFDRRPVTQQMVWTFVREDGEVYLTDDRNVQIEARTHWTPAPWDLTHIEVRRAVGILAIFDEETVAHADYVMSDLADASAVVAEHLPDWSGRFVAYGTSDTSALDELSAMTVDDTAGVAFPVLARDGGPVAAYRFLVNPTVVRDVRSRGLVFRRELVHVALGTTEELSAQALAWARAA